MTTPDRDAKGYVPLHKLPPKPRIIGGLLCFAVAAAVAADTWHKGFVLAFALIPVVIGICMVVSGLVDRKKEKAEREHRRSLRERRGELLRGMLEAKARGESLVRYLTEQGIDDIETRTELIDSLKQIEKSGKAAPGAPPPDAPRPAD